MIDQKSPGDKIRAVKACQDGDDLLNHGTRCVEKFRKITNAIYGAFDIDGILNVAKDDIVEWLGAERITIYYTHAVSGELVSRFKSGSEVTEIRLPANNASIAGYCAANQKLLNIENAYDPDEIKAIDPRLGFDSRWDRETGYRTRQVLAAPIIFKYFVLGVIQLINKKQGGSFTAGEAEKLCRLAEIMGIALYKQKKLAASLKGKFDYLLENRQITREELNQAVVEAGERKKPLERYLVENLHISKKAVLESLSRYHDLPHIEYRDDLPIPGELLEGIDISLMGKNRWAPVRSEGENVLVAVEDPDDFERLDEIQACFPKSRIKIAIAVQQDIVDMIEHFSRGGAWLARAGEPESQIPESGINEKSPAMAELVNRMILDAWDRGASDIHLETDPGEPVARVRFRIQGACVLYQTFAASYQNAVTDRIKNMAGLDTAVRQRPQKGRLRFREFGGKEIDLVVSTIPTREGLEDVVMGFLAAEAPLSLDRLGLSGRNRQAFIASITGPGGMILACGPAGSGKTTMLHSALDYLNTPWRKIWTAEDPVKIVHDGIRQIQVDPRAGYGYAEAVKAVLQGDPDVILVGDIRDPETARLAIEAALGRYLVFSGLRAAGTAEAVCRLLDMGADPFHLADALRYVAGRRLVRTLCEECRRAYHPDRSEYQALVRDYGPGAFRRDLDIDYSEALRLYAPGGCPACAFTGYRGRTGIHEVFTASARIRELIRGRAAAGQLRDQALKEGMVTLLQEGISKVFQGLCDLAEIRKACAETG